MRRIIIDTDTGSDDAVAIVMALRDESVKVEAITTVSGNVDVDQATINALLSAEQARTYIPPVYKGLSMPLVKEQPKRNFLIHGKDGMGDIGYNTTTLKHEDMHAVDFLIDYIESNPNELEIVTLGPVTNLALVCHRSPGTLSKVKKIYMMMGTGVWFGNATPLAEGNAFMDPDALDVVLRCAGAPIVLIGWDLCINEYMFMQKDLERIYATGSPIAKFCLDINHTLATLNQDRFNQKAIDMADPVAMAVALKPDLIADSVTAYTRADTSGGISYGAIAVDTFGKSKRPPNATTCIKLHNKEMKEFLISRIV